MYKLENGFISMHKTCMLGFWAGLFSEDYDPAIWFWLSPEKNAEESSVELGEG